MRRWHEKNVVAGFAGVSQSENFTSAAMIPRDALFLFNPSYSILDISVSDKLPFRSCLRPAEHSIYGLIRFPWRSIKGDYPPASG